MCIVVRYTHDTDTSNSFNSIITSTAMNDNAITTITATTINKTTALTTAASTATLPYTQDESLYTTISPLAPSTFQSRLTTRLQQFHTHLPRPLSLIPLNALLTILLVLLLNILIWLSILILLLTSPSRRPLLSTAALSYSLGLRHALDADHICAIDLMTRRLVAGDIIGGSGSTGSLKGRRPATVGTWFSLGHSTVVVVTSIVVAATAGRLAESFGRFSGIGGIVGSSISAGFLLVLGAVNGWILWKLARELMRVIQTDKDDERNWGNGQVNTGEEDDTGGVMGVSGGGIMFRLLKRLFKLIDRPWKMYPLGILFGLGFDTSSEVALLGIASLQGAKGTSIWLILVFPVLFTVGMCLLDTVDGALMMSVYVAPERVREEKYRVDLGDEVIQKNDKEGLRVEEPSSAVLMMPLSFQDTKKDHNRKNIPTEQHALQHESPLPSSPTAPSPTPLISSPLPFLYYSTLLTLLTVLAALTIGLIQLLTLILNVAVSPETLSRSRFWQGVNTAGDNYDVIGGGICGTFLVVGLAGMVGYKGFKRWVDKFRERARMRREQDFQENSSSGNGGGGGGNRDRREIERGSVDVQARFSICERGGRCCGDEDRIVPVLMDVRSKTSGQFGTRGRLSVDKAVVSP